MQPGHKTAKTKITWHEDDLVNQWLDLDFGSEAPNLQAPTALKFKVVPISNLFLLCVLCETNWSNYLTGLLIRLRK